MNTYTQNNDDKLHSHLNKLNTECSISDAIAAGHRLQKYSRAPRCFWSLSRFLLAITIVAAAAAAAAAGVHGVPFAICNRVSGDYSGQFLWASAVCFF